MNELEAKQAAHWTEIPGWFRWRSGQEEAVRHFEEGSRFVEVGTFLGRSLCSLGEVVQQSGKRFTIVGVDTCLGSGPEGPKGKDFHAGAVREGGGTFAGTLHRNIVACGLARLVTLVISESITAAGLFAEQSIDWVHLDARHDGAHLEADIAAWLPKVRHGGWLSGDDYNEAKWPELVAAVKRTLPGAQPWSKYQWRFVVGTG